MNVSTVTPLLPEGAHRPGTAAGADKPAGAEADFKSFLTLLTAQLRHQDPLQPLDATQFVAQLASFSTVEQLVGVNNRLDAQVGRGDAEATAAYAGWIGHDASAADGRFPASGGTEVFPVAAIPGTERIEAVVMTAGGHEIDRFPVVPDAGGQASWTGAAALGVAPGTPLRIELLHHGSDAVIDRRPAGVFRTIIGLRGSPEGPVFELAGGGILPPGDVAELRGLGTSGTTTSDIAP